MKMGGFHGGRMTLLLAACCGGISCTGVLDVPPEVRAPTELSAREVRHLAETLREMAAAWDAMQQGKAVQRRRAEQSYQRALAEFLSRWDRSQSPRYWPHSASFATQGLSFEMALATDTASARGEVAPSRIDELIFPARVKKHHDADTVALRNGVGVPVVGHIRRTVEERRLHPFLPPNGGNLTLTALMEFEDRPLNAQTPRRCRLHLYDALNVEKVRWRDGEEHPLAANFTTARQLALAKKTLHPFAWTGILYPERTLADCQLYLMDPYDPKRIPIVFVHGLMSDPHIWLNTVNAISADPVLRAAYQPWYFLYPTALTIPRSSAKLRESLRAVWALHDPDGNDPGRRKMVLVGHSMGGLLSRMQVMDPGDKLWNALLEEPPERLDVSESVRQRLVRNLMFRPQPEVARVIFIATPHRGSNLASKNIVRRLTSLIRMPVDTLLMSQELLLGNTDALSQDVRDWGVYGFLSVGMLSEKHPFYKGLNSVPILARHHSIIGDRGRGLGAESSDAVVPYWSSHLDTAQSEKIVPYGHRCVEKDAVVKEIVRVLREHLRSFTDTSTAASGR